MADMKIYERREWNVYIERTEGDDWPDVQEDHNGFLVRPTALRFTVYLDDGALKRRPTGIAMEGDRVLKGGRLGQRIGGRHYLPRDATFHNPYVEDAIAQIGDELLRVER